jgi:spore germination cell wall hydrolase CwlJ-like protein
MKFLFTIYIFMLFSIFPASLHKEQPAVSKLKVSEVNKQVLCLNSALHAEARGEPKEGIKAVLSVIVNRTKHKDYPSDFCSVIKQPYQFSYLNGGKNIVKPTYKPSEHRVKATIEELAFEAAVGSFKPVLDKEYVFYHTVSLKKIPRFSKKGTKHVIIGNHIFIGA